MKIFTVYDSKVESYLQPFFMRSVGEALRGFEDVVNTPDHQFHKHAGDYSLVHIGEYDEKTAELTSLAHPTTLANGLQCLKTQIVPPGPVPEGSISHLRGGSQKPQKNSESSGLQS